MLVRSECRARPRRTARAGSCTTLLNRANGKRRIFEHDRHYLAFDAFWQRCRTRVPMRILAWCVTPNHWHLLLWPREDGDLSTYMRLVTLTHTQRRHAYCASAGTRSSLPGTLQVLRSARRCPLPDRLALRRGRMPFAAISSNAPRTGAGEVSGARWQGKCDQPPQIHPWPVTRPSDWLTFVNQPAEPREDACSTPLRATRRPYGAESWIGTIAERLGLKCTLRPRGRPPKEDDDEPFFEKRVLTPFLLRLRAGVWQRCATGSAPAP